MKINDKIHGFTVTRVRHLDELNAEFIEMTHDKTGLELVWINRDEENKTFGIAFETLPFDDTGVFHILEHSVLCGSEKYPVKEPFVDLLKTSMNTFLNAMTFADKTLYPISSRNDKDFFNLMSVYLDAVFRPEIYNKTEIFYQEGWHYELDENSDASYKGVVFNEMKGVFASADELEEMAINRALFPDSPYRYVSGGDPSHIPDLTYESFIESHRKFYSPSNAYIYFDGNVDIEKALEFTDREYLSKYEKSDRMAPPEKQSPTNGGETHLEYEIGEEEKTTNRTRIAWANVIGTFEDREKIVAMQIIADVLCGSNQSLLTKAVLAEGLAEDVTMSVYDGIAQPWIKIEAQNITDGKSEEAEKLIFDELKKLAENGIERSQLEATMANFEFQMRERDYGSTPQGIIFGIIILETWLYGGDAMQNLVIGDLFDRLRAKMENGYFESLINEVLINDPHKAKVILTPSHTVGDKRRADEQNRILSEKACWDAEEEKLVREKQKKLSDWQNSEDSPEAVATLPKLLLSDITAIPEKIPTEVKTVDGIKTLYHNINCSGILNFSLYFDADDLTENEICELSFLTDILGKVKTAKHSEEEIDLLSRLIFGNLSFFVSTYKTRDSAKKCKIRLTVRFSTLKKNIASALELVAEILKQTSFECEDEACDIIKQLSTRYSQEIIMSGASIGLGRVSAQNSAFGVAKDCSGGFEYYKWLRRNEKNMNWEELKVRLEKLRDKITVKNRLTLTLTGNERNILIDAAGFFADKLPAGEEKSTLNAIKPWGKKREGIIIPADISFACAGGMLSGFERYDGNMAVLSNMISLAYLWNVIRVQGGAYGAGFNVTQNGLCAVYSYRDPSALASLEAYKGISGFISEIESSNEDMTGYIIGAISNAMPVRTPRSKGAKADDDYFSEECYQDKVRFLNEMLNTTASELSKTAKIFDEVFSEPGFCVIGGKNQFDGIETDDIQTI